MTTRYPIPAHQVRAEEILLRSRFITTLAPVPTLDAARAFVAAVRAEFTDATHNCWAYVVGAPGSTAQIGMSDDGEPAGTAGKPMLNVLLGSGVGDVAAVVTRYFGGAKLGTGGLVRAYSGGVKTALQQLPLVEKVERVLLQVILPYRLYQPVERLLPAFEAEVIESQFGAEVTLRVRLPVEHVNDWRGALRELSAGAIQVVE
ncbi:YigZ family protein [Candidatus Amarolinea aalborgensis]|uniref:YigZ family protein n=1 Tax=Candidatus Amarolinea aalborgensis TaxID=2249329 RepID=UPI003BFA1F5D